MAAKVLPSPSGAPGGAGATEHATEEDDSAIPVVNLAPAAAPIAAPPAVAVVRRANTQVLRRSNTGKMSGTSLRRSPTSGGTFLHRSRTNAKVDNRKMMFELRHGKEGAERIRQRTAAVAAEIGQRGFLGELVLLPDKNVALGRWDLLTSLALVYTAVLTPFETSFVPPVVGTSAWTDTWFLINRMLDVIFFFDMILQFFVAYQTGSDFGGRTWITSHKLIIRHYITTWFILDASTVFLPGGFDLWLASDEFDEIDTTVNVESRLSVLRVLRVLRLVKLVRLVRASRLIERWKSKVTLSYGTQTVLQCLFMLALGAHWYACVIGLQAALHVSIDETLFGKELYDLCAYSDDVVYDATKPLPDCQSLTIGTFYGAALSWSFLVIVGVGGVDFYPSKASGAETVVVTILVIFGAFIWTMVLALFVNVATNGDPALTMFRQHLDGLNTYISTHALPKDMAQRMRSYMHQQKGVLLREDAKRALPLLSPSLQIEVTLHVNREWLDSVWFIKGFEPAVKVRLAMAMENKVLAPGEMAPLRYMYVIAVGRIMFGGRCLSRGACWGDDIILSCPAYFARCHARAITYVDVACLSRRKLLEIVTPFPASVRVMRKYTVNLATRRAIVAFARQHKDLTFQTALSKACGDEGAAAVAVMRENMGDFMDRLNQAAASGLVSSQMQSMNIALELHDIMSPMATPRCSTRRQSIGACNAAFSDACSDGEVVASSEVASVGGFGAGGAGNAPNGAGAGGGSSQLLLELRAMRALMDGLRAEVTELKDGQRKLSEQLMK